MPTLFFVSAALPNGAAAKADVVVTALCRLLDVYGPAIAGSGLLEETTAGISHSLCAAQVICAAVSPGLLLNNLFSQRSPQCESLTAA